MKWKPHNNRVIIKPIESKQGIVGVEQPIRGIVVEVASDEAQEWLKGREVIISKYGYNEMELDDNIYYITNAENILLIKDNNL